MQPNTDDPDAPETRPDDARATADAKTRGQAGLLALVVSLVVLTSVVGLALVVVDGAYRSADREPAERRIATSLAEKLVSEESEHTTRANVVNATELHTLTGERLDRAHPFTRETELRIRLGNETLVERGDPTGGTTVRRLVLREHRRQVTRSVGEGPTIPGGSQRATITVPPGGAATTVRANDSVILHEPDGLTGSFEIALTGPEPTRLRIDEGTATVTYAQVRTTPTELVVTVDA